MINMPPSIGEQLLFPIIAIGGVGIIAIAAIKLLPVGEVVEGIGETIENIVDPVQTLFGDIADGSIVGNLAEIIMEGAIMPIVGVLLPGEMSNISDLPRADQIKVLQWLESLGIDVGDQINFLFLDSLGNLVNKAGEILVPFTAKDPDPFFAQRLSEEKDYLASFEALKEKAQSLGLSTLDRTFQQLTDQIATALSNIARREAAAEQARINVEEGFNNQFVIETAQKLRIEAAKTLEIADEQRKRIFTTLSNNALANGVESTYKTFVKTFAVDGVASSILVDWYQFVTGRK